MIDETINHVEIIYSEVLFGHITENSPKQFLGSKNNRVCRFCGKQEPEVSFGKDTHAHAFPEFIGNKKLFTYYECKDCNAFFGKSVDYHFAECFKVLNTLTRIKGKRGIPTYKSKDKNGYCGNA